MERRAADPGSSRRPVEPPWVAASLWATAAALAASAAAWRLFKGGHQVYPDLIVGYVTWTDHYKSFDYLVTGVFLSTFLLTWATCLWLYRGRELFVRCQRAEPEQAPHSDPGRAVVAGAAGFVVSLWFYSGSFPTRSAALLAVFWALVAAPWRARATESWKRVTAVLCGVFAAFSVLGLASAAALSGWAVTAVCAIALGAVPALLLMRDPEPVVWARWLRWSQVLTPLLVLVYSRLSYSYHGSLYSFGGGSAQPILSLIALAAAARIAWWAGQRRLPTPEEGLSVHLAIPAVVALACFLAYRTPEWSVFLRDDFHLGEMLLPWQQIVERGRRIYSDFVSIQGGLDVLYGAVNRHLFAGSAASFPLAFNALRGMGAALGAAAACALLGPGWGLALALAILPLNDRFYLAAPILFLLALPALYSRPALWLLLWGSVSTFHCFFSPSAGFGLTLATVPFAAWWLSAAWRQRSWTSASRREIPLHAGAGVILIALLAMLPLPGLLGFMRDNGSANATAYGLGFRQFPAVPDWFPHRFGPAIDRWSWETVRVGGWLLGGFALWNLFAAEALRRWRSGVWSIPSAFVGLSSFLYVVVLVPYSLGRIDQVALSRTGYVSLLVLATLLPAALAARDRGVPTAQTAALIGAFLGLHTAMDPVSIGDLMRFPATVAEVPADAVLARGSEIGAPRVGDGFMTASKRDELQRLARAVNTLLLPGETYLDLTNRSASYFVLDRTVPAPYAADYLAANASMQRRVTAALEAAPPPLVWIGPRINHDNAPSSLRSYRIYRWVMRQGYRYYEKGGLEFLVRSERADARGLPRRELEAQAAALAKVFAKPDLESLPGAWGSSYRSLARRFERPPGGTPASARQAGPSLEWTWAEPFSGSDLDFALIEAPCDGHPTGRARVLWSDAGHPFSTDRSYVFNLASPWLLLPMGSHPRWLAARSLRRVRLEWEGPACPGIEKTRLSLMRLVD